jgi:hypothetical protein
MAFLFAFVAYNFLFAKIFLDYIALVTISFQLKFIKKLMKSTHLSWHTDSQPPPIEFPSFSLQSKNK